MRVGTDNTTVRSALLLMCLSAPVAGMLLHATQAPVERLIRETTVFLDRHPDSAEGYFTLGRLHGYAFAEVMQAPVCARHDPDAMVEIQDQSPTGPARESRASMRPDSREHFFAALKCYRRAIELDNTEPIYHYNLAWMDQQGAVFSEELGRPASRFNDEALEEYRAAYHLCDPDFGTPFGMPAILKAPITAEAAVRIVRILSDRYGSSDHSAEAAAARAEMASITRDLKTMERKPQPTIALSCHP